MSEKKRSKRIVIVVSVLLVGIVFGTPIVLFNLWYPDSIVFVPANLVRVALLLGPGVNGKGPDGATGLHVCASYADFKKTKIFIDAGADVEARTNEGLTPLHGAAPNAWATLYTMDLLIKSGANINARTNSGMTPLMIAARFGEASPEVIRYLIDKGADVSVQDKQGNTALHYAIEMGNFSLVEPLANGGADIFVKNSRGNSALDYAMMQKDKRPLKFLIARIDRKDRTNEMQTLLRQAVMMADLELIKILVEKGADINAKDAHGETPLDLVRRLGGDSEVLRYLESLKHVHEP